MQKTLVIIKPDAVQRRLMGKIISRFEEKGCEIIGLRLTVISEEQAREHYGTHEGKDFYEKLIEYINSGPVVLLVLRGKNIIDVTRKMMGSTFGGDAAPGTIRGDLAVSNRFNLIHGSDSEESAEKEIEFFFGKDSLIDIKHSDLEWVYDITGDSIV